MHPSLSAKKPIYNSNGTGRDGYIAMSNGGFYPQKGVAEYTQTFKEQLRSPSEV